MTAVLIVLWKMLFALVLCMCVFLKHEDPLTPGHFFPREAALKLLQIHRNVHFLFTICPSSLAHAGQPLSEGTFVNYTRIFESAFRK